ncbi:response regulator transcription factor [Bacillus sp. NP157]|nr:response regulator transcription factor [Bacillus sp. NP157]
MTATLSDTPTTLGRRIAVLEDDAMLREDVIAPGLRDFGFDVFTAGSAAELYRGMIGHVFDIVLLDIGLPDEDGLTVARHLRQMGDMGIVMLTGSNARHNHLSALQLGADAFLSKPVDVDILAGTLHALGRRLRGGNASAGPTTPAGAVAPAAAAEAWRLDAEGWCLMAPNGSVLALTAPERALMAALVDAHGQPVARETLIAALCTDVYAFDPHRLDMLVHRLRRKATDAGAGTLPLLTSRGSGYLFANG